MPFKKVKYNHNPKPRRGLRRVVMVGLVILFALVIAAVFVRQDYYADLKPVSSSNQIKFVTIQDGMSTPDIANLLKSDGLIRSADVFEWYVGSHGAHSDLQAGTYALKPSMGLAQIVNILSDGKVATNLVTILPGQRLDQIEAALIKSGFQASAVQAALNPANYANNPTLVDKPASANLEGYLYPDTFQKNDNTSPQVIIEESLNEMGQHLTPAIRAAFAKEGLSVYQGISLASIVEQEVSTQSDRNQVAQVFLSRLKVNMPLGSDVTAYYGALLAGELPSTAYDSPYNTLLHKGLPPGPISNVSQSSLEAVAYPANTQWLYFVTGDNGITYFSKTAQEHDQQTAQYCHKLCSETP